MTSGYILIAAIFLLGGLIAAFGDRLGTKIGKARLRLFNLRPRQTAMVITVVTGMLISALTLGILFSVSKSLRRGIFELDDILKEKRQIKGELEQVNQEKSEVQQQLAQVRDEQVKASENLEAINLDFAQSQQELEASSSRAKKLRQELDNLLTKRKQELNQLNSLKQQSQTLQGQLEQQNQVLTQKESRLQELEQQQQILQSQVQERDNSIAKLDEAIVAAEVSLKLRTQRLEELESQLEFLARDVAVLEQSYQELREKKIAIVKGQVLSSAVVRIIDPNAAKSAIDGLLRQANKNAVKATQFDGKSSQQRIVKITSAQVKQLETQIEDGQDYVLRILSAGNYVQGEKEVRVFADLALNKQVFKAGEEIATVSIDSRNVTRKEIQERLNWLLAVSKFRAQRAGTLGEIEIGNNQIESIVDFINKVTRTEVPVSEIKAVVQENTFTAGPLKLNFVVMRDGKVILST